MSFFKKIIFLMLFGLILYALLVRHNDRIKESSSVYIYSEISKIPAKKALLLLGTTKYLKNGHINYFYKYRIDSAVRLFNAGKVKAIVVSGDNGTKSYDEPTTMHDDLVARGIPSNYITLDYAGFRTLDSIVRAKAIFDLEDYIIVSQRFHLERAIYIAQAKGQKVIGFVAKDFKNTVWAKRMENRELLARAKAFIDLYILEKEPRFYGSKVKVNYK
jgi:SanA protein